MAEGGGQGGEGGGRHCEPLGTISVIVVVHPQLRIFFP